ncbi:MAG: hypothetical protein ABSD20_09825 [Terriglobales bacterium]
MRLDLSKLEGLLPRKGVERRPIIACEFSAVQVVVGRAANASLMDVSAVRMLPPGAIVPNLTGTNIVSRSAVQSTLQEAMLVVGNRTRDVIFVLPDAACRVALLEFETIPDKREDAEAIIRFRLKKSLPFDVEQARISWQVQRVNGKLTTVAAVILSTVLEEYEATLREAGLSPGVVMPSILAALGQVDTSLPTLVIKVDPNTTSIAIVNENALLLIRSLDHPSGIPPQGAQLADDVHPSLVFFEDTYGAKVGRILVSGIPDLAELNAALSESTGITAEELVSPSRVGAAAAHQLASLGAVAGALA